MTQQVQKKYDLEERTQKFTKDVRIFLKQVSATRINMEDMKQLLRSSGSVSANYIEANESLSKKDFLHRIKICRKEAKESALWITVLDIPDDPALVHERDRLYQEAKQFVYIFAAILRSSGAIR